MTEDENCEMEKIEIKQFRISLIVKYLYPNVHDRLTHSFTSWHVSLKSKMILTSGKARIDLQRNSRYSFAMPGNEFTYCYKAEIEALRTRIVYSDKR